MGKDGETVISWLWIMPKCHATCKVLNQSNNDAEWKMGGAIAYLKQKESKLRKEAMSKNKAVEKIVENGTIVAGTEACAIGTTAAVIGVTTTVTTAGASAAAVTAAGATIGGAVLGTAGAVAGAGIGIATGGAAIAGTIPLAATGAVTGSAIGGSIATTVASWLGIPLATTTTVVTAPAWAIPVAIAGGVAVLGASGLKLYKRFHK